jgi:uncharacterized membrane protein YfcA
MPTATSPISGKFTILLLLLLLLLLQKKKKKKKKKNEKKIKINEKTIEK